MNTEIFRKNLLAIQRQRNMFIIIAAFSLATNILLATKNLLSKERVILVPGLNQTVWLEKNTVSSSYIEEMTILVLSHLLDISSKNLEYKKSLILNHISKKDSVAHDILNKYFIDIEKKYKKFDLNTYFTTKKILIDPDNLTAKVEGLLTSYYGKRASDISEAEYLISFELDRGILKLKSFLQIQNDKN